MIDFHYETDFTLQDERKYIDWITRIFESEKARFEQIDYVFCSDEYLYKLNREFLNHETYTDIITFDYSENGLFSGDVFISVERVADNAVKWRQPFNIELLRVMAHGILHLMGYNDKSKKGKEEMRGLEEEKIKLFHVEQ